jgi:hypothetical protein
MRRIAPLALAPLAAGCSLYASTPASPPSPHCRPGDPLAGVYHPDRLHVRRSCVVATGIVEKVKFEEYDGDVHVDLRPDDASRNLLSSGNDQVGGNLVVEIIPQDRASVLVPDVGATVTVVGPWVDDETHGWREIHPAWWISSGRIVPASPVELERVGSLLEPGTEEQGD